jgi:tetratricopeptide (TPR) repeat protein
VKSRLVVVVIGLTVMVGRCWAGDVQPSAGPRFGVEGERHRMVLPLSTLPAEPPSVRTSVWSAEVTLPDLHVASPQVHDVGAPRAPRDGIRSVVTYPGGVSLHAQRVIEEAKAFVLRAPPRLVVDLYLRGRAGAGTGEDRAEGTATPENETIDTDAPAIRAETVRFGVSGDRHRIVVPLSDLPGDSPVVHAGVRTVDVVLAGLEPDDAVYRPPLGSASARVTRDARLHTGGVTLRTDRPVGEARAFLLREPPRLVIDVHPDAGPRSMASRAHAGGAKKPAAPRVAAAPPEAPPAPAHPQSSEGAAAPTTVAHADARPVDTPEDASPGAVGHEPAAGEAHVEPPEPSGSATEVATGPPPPAESAGGDTGAADYRLGEFEGYPMLWPDLSSSLYTQADTGVATARFLTPRRQAVTALRTGAAESGEDASGAAAVAPVVVAPLEVATRAVERGAGESTPAAGPEATHGRPLPDANPGAIPAHAPAAAHFLEADIAYLRAAAGEGSFFSAAALYHRAVRLAPRFPDRDRGRLMLGFTKLSQGLAPEAEGEFVFLANRAPGPGVTAWALFGAGRAARASGSIERASSYLRRAITTGVRSEGACQARSMLGALLAESGRGSEALAVSDEMRAVCPASVVGAPRILLNQVGILAAAGRVQDAETLLLALPEFEGELFVRRKFLEADLAVAAGRSEFARRAYEAVSADRKVPLRVRGEAALRLARLEDREGDLDRARSILRQARARQREVTMQGRALATEAKILAGHGRYPEAMDLLAEADALGPAGLAAAEAARPQIFRDWVERLAAADDDAAILTVFYRHRADGIGRHLGPPEVLRVAQAAAAVGLPDLAMRIVSPVHEQLRGKGRLAARRLLASAALAKGENAHAVRFADQAEAGSEPPEARAEAQRLRAEGLLALGRVDEAAALLGALGGREELLTLGNAYLRDVGDPQRAVEVLERALREPAAPAAETAPGTRDAAEDSRALEGWLALAEAADLQGRPGLTASALREAARLASGEAVAGLHYHLARAEAAEAQPERAAETYAAAAEHEQDPLLARAAAAGAQYYRTIGRQGGPR